jgi:hypothetical protein
MMPFVLTRRPVPAAIITLILTAIVGLVVLSPFALAGIAHFRSDWVELSNIGQTYGAVSAILSGLALGGIIASLLYQARDSRIAHEQMKRTFQFDLIKLELDDPSLMAAIGAPWGIDALSDAELVREFLYVQMWVTSWVASYATGDFPESVVRQLAAHELFRGRAGRIYWESAGRRQLASSRGRQNRFFRILDEEYNKVISNGIPVAAPLKPGGGSAVPGNSPLSHAKSLEREGAVAISVIAGVLVGWALATRRQRLGGLG